MLGMQFVFNLTVAVPTSQPTRYSNALLYALTCLYNTVSRNVCLTLYASLHFTFAFLLHYFQFNQLLVQNFSYSPCINVLFFQELCLFLHECLLEFNQLGLSFAQNSNSHACLGFIKHRLPASLS